MTKINLLPNEIISLIAAGEVVERPANIVKELVENSLDANADKIEIIITDGGLGSITVRDNGEGIPVNEIEEAFKLHTTSKLSNKEISSVSTLGFRGEALSSISIVTRVECSTKSKNDKMGVKIVLEGGGLISINELSISQGTLISISGIFFNTPARRKFLKTSNTERKRIFDLISSYSLIYPPIHFILIEVEKNNKKKILLESPKREKLLSVIFDVLGSNIANGLIFFKKKIGIWELKGYISKPQLNRSDRSQQYLSVNGRPVKHIELQTIIENAYGSQKMRNSHPIIILSLIGPANSVDFNIHPQKSEIRFKSNDLLFDEIPYLIDKILNENIEIPVLEEGKLENVPNFELKSSSVTFTKNEIKNTFTKQSTLDEFNLNQGISKSEEKKNFVVHGQIMEKFGVIEVSNELWLLDIHAADERIKFEMFSEGKEREVSSQQFLEPIPIELTLSEKTFLLNSSTNLQKFGMKISNHISNSIFIHSMPIYYDQKITEISIKELIKDILSYYEKNIGENPIETVFNQIEYSIVSRLACHGSIRSGHLVSKEKIEEILIKLKNCNYPWTCAHGRPTILRLSKSRLEGWFKR